MSDQHDSQDWLDPQTFECPQCGTLLFRVVHSPFYDHWQLYCDSCANSVEVSYYDKTADALTASVSSDVSVTSDERYAAQMRAIEGALKRCACGGRYRHDAPRRCYVCNTPVVDDATGIDLWPGFVNADEDVDPTPDQVVEVERFVSAHVRAQDIWRTNADADEGS
jgi:hypothetical protein